MGLVPEKLNVAPGRVCTALLKADRTFVAFGSEITMSKQKSPDSQTWIDRGPVTRA